MDSSFTVIITARGRIGMSSYEKNAGEKIKYYRTLCKMSQEELAEAVDLSMKHISTLEKGETMMGIDTLERFCAFFGVTPNDLLTEPVPEDGMAKKRRLSPQEVLIQSIVAARNLYYALQCDSEAE